MFARQVGMWIRGENLTVARFNATVFGAACKSVFFVYPEHVRAVISPTLDHLRGDTIPLLASAVQSLDVDFDLRTIQSQVPRVHAYAGLCLELAIFEHVCLYLWWSAQCFCAPDFGVVRGPSTGGCPCLNSHHERGECRARVPNWVLVWSSLRSSCRGACISNRRLVPVWSRCLRAGVPPACSAPGRACACPPVFRPLSACSSRTRR